MGPHRWHSLGWALWAIFTVGFFAVWEYIGLVNREDDKQPLTYFIRKAVGTPNNPLWWIVGAIFIWCVYHFLVVHNNG
jgi:hypothetical protein